MARSQEHDPPGTNFAVGSVGTATSPERHGFAFGLAGFSQHDLGSPAASDFEQQQPRVAFSTIVQEQEAPTQPPDTAGAAGRNAITNGTATDGVNWPNRAVTARANRSVSCRMSNGAFREVL